MKLGKLTFSSIEEIADALEREAAILRRQLLTEGSPGMLAIADCGRLILALDQVDAIQKGARRFYRDSSAAAWALANSEIDDAPVPGGEGG